MDPKLETASSEIVQASAPVQQPVVEKSKKSKGLIATATIMTILALAGIAGAIYFFMDANNKTFEITDLKNKIELLKEETGVEITNDGGGIEITTSDEAKVKELVIGIRDKLEEVYERNFDLTYSDTGSIIRISGTDAFTISKEYYGVTSGMYIDASNNPAAQAIMSGAHDTVIDYLTTKGFKKALSNGFADVYENTEANMFCDVYGQSLPFITNCTSGNWFDDSNKDLIISLSKAAGDNVVVNTTAEKIENSTVSPYQKLRAGTTDAVLLYYRVSPDAEWQFFTVTQGVLSCSEYNTEDLKKAFAGEQCLDESTTELSTVQP